MKRIPCDTYSRVVGYFQPLKNWNPGKKSEFADRVTYDIKKSMEVKKDNGFK